MLGIDAWFHFYFIIFLHFLIFSTPSLPFPFPQSGTCEINDLKQAIPSDSPSFTLFRWKHSFDGTAQDSYVFIYCCPMAAKVKLKMLYSTVNKAAIGAIEQAGVKIAKKVEIESPSELSEEDLMTELHPMPRASSSQKLTGPNKFSKPMRPGKGRPRMTRS